jgi:hypothetical protein
MWMQIHELHGLLKCQESIGEDQTKERKTLLKRLKDEGHDMIGYGKAMMPHKDLIAFLLYLMFGLQPFFQH